LTNFSNIGYITGPAFIIKSYILLYFAMVTTGKLNIYKS